MNNPDVWKLLALILGVIGGLLTYLQLRQRGRLKQLDIKMRSVEADIDRGKEESQRQTLLVNGMTQFANSQRDMARAMLERGEAQDAERAAHRATLEQLTVAFREQTTHIGELVQENARKAEVMVQQAQAIHDLRQEETTGRKDAVGAIISHVDVRLDDSTDILATIYDTLTEIKDGIATHRANDVEVVKKLDQILTKLSPVREEIAPPDDVPAEGKPDEGKAA